MDMFGQSVLEGGGIVSGPVHLHCGKKVASCLNQNQLAALWNVSSSVVLLFRYLPCQQEVSKLLGLQQSQNG